MKRTCLFAVSAAITLAGAAETPLLRFGVASDVHILRDWSDPFTPGLTNQAIHLEKALRWFDAEGAEAVLFPGDMAHGGRVSELETFVAVWNKVFPGGKGSDGRKVERLVVTGNHEIGQWDSLWNGISDAELRKVRVDYDLPHLKANWLRIFGEPFELVWKREVKGISFIGVQYSSLKPDIDAFFRAHAAELDPKKPFFVFQHRPPAFTCHASAFGPEELALTRILSAYPNAVAIGGHTHYTPTDDRNVWQGAFTAIDAGCSCSAEPSYPGLKLENGGAPWAWEYKKQRMRCLDQCGNEGRACLMAELYSDRLVIHRKSLEFDEPMGPDWTIPLPAAPGGPFDYDVCARTKPTPEFPADAKVSVVIGMGDAPNVGPGLRGKPCVKVTFPHAEAVGGMRVMGYELQVFGNGREVFSAKAVSYGFCLPESRSRVPGEFYLSPDDLPKGVALQFAVRPFNFYQRLGAAILSAPVTCK